MIGHKKARRFVIDGLSRTGSTALAHIIPLCSNANCLVEPFHPRRYNGRYNKAARDSASIRLMLQLIWQRWDGIKHIWIAPEGFPFRGQPWLNDEIVLNAEAVIVVRRRNYLQRYVSSMISQRLQFWIGKKHEYRERLDQGGTPELSPEAVLHAIEEDRKAMAHKEQVLINHRVDFINVYYEDVFGVDIQAAEQVRQVNRVLRFIGLDEMPGNVPRTEEWREIMCRDLCKWNSRETYEQLPGAWELELKVGSNENGWLFRE